MSAKGYTLERRGKDRWRVTISLGFNCATGQYDRYRETIRAATKTEASRKAEAIRNRVLGTSDADAGKMTVAAYISDYLENVAPLNVRSSTLRGYVGCAERYIYPSWLGGLLMLAVTPPAMERYYQEISKRGGRYGGPLSGKTVHNVHVIIHKAFARAATHGVIPFNPTNVTLPKQFKIREIIILEIDDLARLNALIHEMPDRPLAIAIAIALHTGLRRGEVLGLHWDDIDFERNQIKVSHPIHQLLGGKTEHGDPKTEKSARTVKMTADLRQMLLEYKLYCEIFFERNGAKLTQKTPVVIREDGRHMLPDHLSRVSVKLFRAQDFPKGFTFHGLRHTHASYLIASGVPIKVISERLGHSSIAMTMDIYGHLLDGQDEAASDAFDQALKAASCKNVSPQFGPKDTVASQQK